MSQVKGLREVLPARAHYRRHEDHGWNSRAARYLCDELTTPENAEGSGASTAFAAALERMPARDPIDSRSDDPAFAPSIQRPID